MKQNNIHRKGYDSNSVFDKTYKLAFLLIPFIIVFALGSSLMGIKETLPLVTWVAVLMLIGLTTYPIATKIFTNSGSGGFFLSQVLGLLTTSFIVWTFTYLKIMRFNTLCVVLVLIAVAAFSYGYSPLRNELVNKLGKKGVFERLVIEESIFAIVLVILCYYKGFNPDINGQEKFMDYGFIMSMLRNPKLPANDMWLSGFPINYYYFGQYIYALLIKITGVATGVGYNIAMCSAIAIPFTMAYSIGCMLIDTSRNYGLRCGKYMTQAAGLLSGFAVMIFGNSHSFFYDQESAGHGLLKLFDSWGLKVGNYKGTNPNYSFFYPDSTRYIGYNPDSKVINASGEVTDPGDYTIEEFPFYSYLVGDLHAHVVSTMLVLLIMAVCFALVTKFVVPENASKYAARLANTEEPLFSVDKFKSEIKSVLSLELIVIGLLLGCAQMTNYWDFLIYFIFSSMTLFILNTRTSARFATPAGIIYFVIIIGGILGGYLTSSSLPLLHTVFQLMVVVMSFVLLVMEPCALTRTTSGMSVIFTLSTIAALPFNMNFDMISNALGMTKHHTDPYQLYILWGTHAFVCITFVVFTILFKNYPYRPNSKKKNKSYANNVIGSNDYSNPVQKFFGERNLVDVFVCGMIVVGFLMIIAPEIFYVRDIYTGGYLRANTMFKFCYAAFIILSMAMAYAIIRLFWIVGKSGDYNNVAYALTIAFCVLMIIPAHYTLTSLEQRSGDLKKNNFKTLDGTAYLDTYESGDVAKLGEPNMLAYRDAINWLNNNVSGSPVILESFGLSYTDYNIVSAYTGLPTVRGWQTHEQLWRFHGIIDKETDTLVDDPKHSVWDLLDPRTEAIRDMYGLSMWADAITNDTINYGATLQLKLNDYGIDYNVDPADTTTYSEATKLILQSIIDKYDIEYIIIGDLERAQFNLDNRYTLFELGEVVYSNEQYANGPLYIIKTTPN